MKITIEQLEKLGRGCEDGRAWFLKQKNTELCVLLKAAITGGDDTQNYASWGLTRLMNPQQRVRYACFAARQTLKNYTKVYPGDSRVLAAIEAAEKWALDPSEANRLAAWSAAGSETWSAARSETWSAARSAAWSAAAAARSAARSAAWSARSAAESAELAAESAESAVWSAARSARSAAAAAAKSRMKSKILRFGAKLLKTVDVA